MLRKPESNDDKNLKPVRAAPRIALEYVCKLPKVKIKQIPDEKTVMRTQIL